MKTYNDIQKEIANIKSKDSIDFFDKYMNIYNNNKRVFINEAIRRINSEK